MTALIFDTETHKLHGDIIEAAAIDVRFFGKPDQRTLERTCFEYQKRFKPSEPIGLGAMAVHHIVDEDLVKCPSFTKFQMPKDDVKYLIGHNIDYDIAAINRAGIDTNGIKAICTLAMARYMWPTLDAHNLTALAYHISSDRKATRRALRNSHSALTDCKTTFSLVARIIREKNITSLEELWEFSQQARYPTYIFFGKYKGWAIKDMDDYDLGWLLQRTDEAYLRISLQNEFEERQNISENEELPFI